MLLPSKSIIPSLVYRNMGLLVSACPFLSSAIPIIPFFFSRFVCCCQFIMGAEVVEQQKRGCWMMAYGCVGATDSQLEANRLESLSLSVVEVP